MTSRATASCVAILLALSPLAAAQTARSTCRDGNKIALEVDYDDSSLIFTYHLSDPKIFSAAKVEVWDRPQRLSAKQVPVRKQGQIAWAPKKEPPETPSELRISILDPSGNSNVSDVLIGGMRDEGGPSPSFPNQTFILQEGGGSPDLTIEGTRLSPVTKFLLMEQETPGIWIEREYLTGVLADLQHTRVQIPAGYLSRPTVLNLGPITVHVMSKDRPVLTGIEPTSISADSAADGLTIRLLGSGFTPESRAVTVFAENVHDLATKTVFVSPNELQVSLDAGYSGVDSESTRADRIQFWVTNGDDLHVSDAQELHILPTATRPLRSKLVPLITSTSPYPVPLMDSQSPAFLELSVYGDNFREDLSVVASNDDVQGVKLKTEYISPQELHALLPRELWQVHRYSFRLVTQTPTGICSAEVWEDSE